MNVGFRLLAIALLATPACSRKEQPVVAMHFGVTDWVWNHPGPASDYIRDFHHAIPAAAKRCGVTLLGMNGSMTDGAEAAYFGSDNDPNTVISCLQKTMPKVHFETIDRLEWKRLKAENPGFPLPLELIPEQVELPPPDPAENATHGHQ